MVAEFLSSPGERGPVIRFGFHVLGVFCGRNGGTGALPDGQVRGGHDLYARLIELIEDVLVKL